MSKIALERSKTELIVSRKRLASKWGSSEPVFTTAVGDLETVMDSTPPLKALKSQLDICPEIAKWVNVIELKHAAITLEKSAGIPDVKVFAGVQHFRPTGENYITFGLSLPMPVFDRNQGNIRASRYNLSKSREQQHGAINHARRELAEVYNALTVSRIEALTLHNAVLPAANTAFKATSEGYRQGEFGYLEMLDAQQTLFEAKTRHIEALASYHTTKADVERLIGCTLESVLFPKERS